MHKEMSRLLSLIFIVPLLSACSKDSNSPALAAAAAATVPQISYDGSTVLVSLKANVSNSIVPTNSGLPVTNCSIQPSLPAGLVFDSATCGISGTPRGAFSSIYKVTAANGSVAAVLDVTITSSLPPETLLGQFDASFGTNGIMASISLASSQTIAYAPIPGGGKSIVLNSVFMSGTYSVNRLQADGSVDAGFTVPSYTCLQLFAKSSCTPYRMKVQSDGKILILGFASDTPDYKLGLVRLNADGTIDAGYGTAGVATADFANHLASDATSLQLVIEPVTGKAVVLVQENTTFTPAVARFLVNGTLDTSFDTDGIVNITQAAPGSGPASNSPRALAFDINTGGYVIAADNGNLGGVLMRISANGTFDTNFGSDGSGFVSDTGAMGVQRLAVYTNGRILLSGMSYLKRFSADGEVEAAFAPTFAMGIGFPSNVGLLIESSEHILVLRNIMVMSFVPPFMMTFTNHTDLIRILPDGTLDATFTVQTNSAAALSPVDMNPRADGRVVIASSVSGMSGTSLIMVK